MVNPRPTLRQVAGPFEIDAGPDARNAVTHQLFDKRVQRLEGPQARRTVNVKSLILKEGHVTLWGAPDFHVSIE
jgi:hypothetical protein